MASGDDPGKKEPQELHVQISELSDAVSSLHERLGAIEKAKLVCAECSCGPCFECSTCRTCRVCHVCHVCQVCRTCICAECGGCGPCAQ